MHHLPDSFLTNINKQKSKKHAGYLIRTISFEPDVHKWEMSLVTEEDHVFRFRALRVVGPSQSCLIGLINGLVDWLADPSLEDSLLVANKELENSNTDGGNERQQAHYLIVFELGIVLSNAVFSDDTPEVKGSSCKFKLRTARANELGFLGDEAHIEFFNLCWKIAIKDQFKELSTTRSMFYDPDAMAIDA